MDKLNSLTNTLDTFLKRLTDTEQEFTFMKHDVTRIKAVLERRLGSPSTDRFHWISISNRPCSSGLLIALSWLAGAGSYPEQRTTDRIGYGPFRP